MFRAACLVLAVLGASCRSPDSNGIPDPDGRAIVLAVLPEPSAASAADRAPQDRVLRLVDGGRFWAEKQIVLEARAGSAWMTAGEPVELLLDLENLGAQDLLITFRKRPSILSHVRTGTAVLDLARRSESVGRGGRRDVDHRAIGFPDDDVHLPPGCRRRFVVPLPEGLGQGADFQDVRARLTLYPLSIRLGDEPEKFVALRFPEVRLRTGRAPVEDRLDPAQWPDHLDELLAADPRAVVAWAVRRAEDDVLRLVDLLQTRLPGRNPLSRASLLCALRCSTGLDLDDEVEIWRSWWSSADGARWAAKHRHGGVGDELRFEGPVPVSRDQDRAR